MTFTSVVELAGRVIEALGVAVILIGAVVATIRFLIQLQQQTAGRVMYKTYRVGLAQAILLGLEFLVAGDIIRTVAIEPTLENVAVLAIIVGIRTILSWSLQLEIEGHWPWQSARAADTAK